MLPFDFYRHRADQLLAVRPQSTSRDELARRIQHNALDPQADLLVADMDAAGVDHAVVIGTDWALLSSDPEPETHPRHHLQVFGEMVTRHPGRLSVVLGVDPRRPDAVDVTRAALQEPWVHGIKLYPPMGFSPSDERCAPIYREVVAAGAFAMFHTGRQSFPFDLAHGRVEPYSAVQRANPDLTIVLAHSGWPFWGMEAIEVASGHTNTYLDVSGWHHGMADGRAEVFLRAALSRLGSRVLFASDHLAGPHASGERSHMGAWLATYCGIAEECGVPVGTTMASAARLLKMEEVAAA